MVAICISNRLTAADNAMKSLGVALASLSRRTDVAAANAGQARERAECSALVQDHLVGQGVEDGRPVKPVAAAGDQDPPHHFFFLPQDGLVNLDQREAWAFLASMTSSTYCDGGRGEGSSPV